MTEPIYGLAFSVDGLRRDADEIEACGGGNEAAAMRWAAAEIDRLRGTIAKPTLAQIAHLYPEVRALVKAATPYVSPVQNADYGRQLREYEALNAALAPFTKGDEE